MKVFISSDHAGFKLKGEVISWVKELGHEAVDLGPFKYDPNDDYPDYIKLTAKEVAADSEAKGIVLGASGEGEAMVANRFPRVRATAYYGGNREIIKLSRQHNDANILSLGARFLTDAEAKEMVVLWLSMSFSGEKRHTRRIEEIDQIMTEKWYKKLLKLRLFRR
jgi:ribose 5-phosphate isomerase B